CCDMAINYIYTLSLHDALPISQWEELNYGMFIHWGLYSKIGGVWEDEPVTKGYSEQIQMWANISEEDYLKVASQFTADQFDADEDRKSTRLNSSHVSISYAVFC